MPRFSKWITRFLPMILLGLLLAGYAYGQNNSGSNEVRWSQPTRLGDGWFSSIAVDREGGVHISWYGGVPIEDGSGDYDALFYAYHPLDGEWTAGNDVIFTGAGGYTVRNALAAGSDGTLYAVLRNFVYHVFSRAYATDASDAHAWSAPVQLDNNGYYVDMAIDRNEVLHVVYSGYAPDSVFQGNAESGQCAFCFDMLYTRSTNGGTSWSIPVLISDLPDSGSDRVRIWEGASGRLYASWDEGVDWYVGRGRYKDVRLRYSDDSGLTWSDPIIMDGGDQPGVRPFQGAFVEMADGRLMAVYRYSTEQDPRIYYQISDDLGQTWTPPAPIDGFYGRSFTDSSTTLDRIALEIDYLGTIHLFAVGQNDPTSPLNVSLYHIEYRQGAWRLPQRVFYDPQRRPEWPQVRFGTENDIHLTFFTRAISAEGLRENERYDTVALEVWYMHRTGTLLNRPTLAFEPTETLRPSPTVFQKLDPTTTPFPTLPEREENFAMVTRDTYAIETVMGGVLAVGAFCLVIILGLRLRR
ncbi:MAG: exo-alpha-sialidase [Anaerolineaceae bacterium]|nr:exo-alpha-sialidase [Anaerolineaceae bacterium]